VEAAAEWPVFSALYVVENPSVFSALLDAMQALGPFRGGAAGADPVACPALICTSGRPSTAASLFIRKSLEAAKEGTKLYYAGDFDVGGLQMAASMEARFPDAFEAWHMDTGVYRTYVSGDGPAFSEEERRLLEQIELPWDAGLGAAMAERGVKCFQETALAKLSRDWLEAVGRCQDDRRNA
jgi:uncharacterized protein (TIGR02679 family)